MPRSSPTAQHLVEVLVRLGAQLVHGLERSAGELELPAGLERNGAAVGFPARPLQRDDVVALP